MGKKKKDRERGVKEVEVTGSDGNETVDDSMEDGVTVEAVSEKAADEQASAPEKEQDEKEQLTSQVEQLEDQLLRARADLDNYKKRTARQYENVVHRANDRLIGELLEIVDNFERALQHTDNNSDAEPYREGTELILNQMIELLARYDVRPMEVLGKPFDPNLHEAMMQIDSEEYDEGVVAVEINKGYMQGKRVLRHARVGVSKGKAVAEETD